MPIRPENKIRYPKNWKSEVVPRIRARSGDRCECTGQCGRKHGPAARGDTVLGDRCTRINGEPIEMGVANPCIVLTVAHLNHRPEDCDDANLLHLCQGCHNRYDAPTRRAGIKARARAGRADGDLFKCE